MVYLSDYLIFTAILWPVFHCISLTCTLSSKKECQSVERVYLWFIFGECLVASISTIVVNLPVNVDVDSLHRYGPDGLHWVDAMAALHGLHVVRRGL